MNREKLQLISEGILYGLLGAVFVTTAVEISEYYRQLQLRESGLIADHTIHSIGILPLFAGICISAISGNYLFYKSEKSAWLKWTFVIVLSSILSIFIQLLASFCLFNPKEKTLFEEFGFLWGDGWFLEWILKLLSLLFIFTVIFSGCKLLIHGLRDKTSRKGEQAT